MYQELLGMRQNEVRASVVGLEREALNLISGDDIPLASSTSHTPATHFSQSELATI